MQAELKTLQIWIEQDAVRMEILKTLQSLAIPDAWIAAGFVRNLVWDRLHGYKHNTILHDVDVIYFAKDGTESQQKLLEKSLTQRLPTANWQVKNQALMHERNGDLPYVDCQDAMSYWPECETAVAVRLHKDKLEFLTAFGWESLFALQITYNPKRSWSTFIQRVEDKKWQTLWPKLQLQKS